MKFIRNIILVIYVLLFGSSCYSGRAIKEEVLINLADIEVTNFADGVPYSQKIYEDFIQDKFVVLGVSALVVIEKEDRQKTKYLKYETPSLNPTLIRIDGKMRIVAGGGGFLPVGLMNDQGELLWKYIPDPKFDPFDMEGGDLYKDGITEFYVGNHDGVHSLDMNGKMIKKTWPLWIHDVEIGKYNSDDVVIGLSRNVFYFWDYKGNLIKKFDLKVNFSHFVIINWPTKHNILTSNGNDIYLVDMEGNIILKKKVDHKIYDINGTAVYFNESSMPYLAIVANYSSSYNKSLLCVFSPDGKMIYKEVIGSTQAILAVDRKYGKSQYLLVGGFPKIKKYELK